MPLHVALIGPGLVGKAVLGQLRPYVESSSVRLVAIVNSKTMTLGASLPLDQLDEMLRDATQSQPLDYATFLSHIISLGASSWGSVVVDCTASQSVAEMYPSWLRKGLHVVTPNKKAFSGDLGLWRDILKCTARKQMGVPSHSLCLNEATVGAGLPVLSTLRDLIVTGDRIIRIEGVFSGTLSYIFNTFCPATPSNDAPCFSAVVKKAKMLGYTEPDPRDDLNGMDVARKVVILARQCGVPLTLETLPVENIVPAPLRSISSSESFMNALSEYDDHFDALRQDAWSNGSVVRCVGVMRTQADANGNTSEVKVAKYPRTHPFASLSGADNVVAFHTERFKSTPLLVQGAGAGADVTAHGVVSDLLKVLEVVSYAKP